MTPSIRLRSHVRATAAEVRTGLLFYVSIYYGNLVLSGITVRRTGDGRVDVSFPVRIDNAGRKHAIVLPIDSASRQHIRREILKALGPQLAEILP